MNYLDTDEFKLTVEHNKEDWGLKKEKTIAAYILEGNFLGPQQSNLQLYQEL